MNISSLTSEQITTIVSSLYPLVQIKGSEALIGSLSGEPGQSLSVSLKDGQGGKWIERNGGTKGNIFTLVKEAKGVDGKGAYEYLEDILGIVRQPMRKGTKAVLKISDVKLKEKGLSIVTESVPFMEQVLPLGFTNKNGRAPQYINLFPDSIYPYKNFEGKLLGYVYRYEASTLQKADNNVKKKVNMPVSYFSDSNWYAKGLSAYPFYGSEQISSSKGTYLFHEGEKCADLASKAFPLITSLATQGGSDGLGKNGRRLLIETQTINAFKNGQVFILPDNDPAGAHYAKQFKTLLEVHGVTVTVLSISFVEQKLNTVLEDGADIEQLIGAGLTEEILCEWMSYANNNEDFRNCVAEQKRQDNSNSYGDDDSADSLTVKQMVNSFIELVLYSITEAYKDKSNDDVYIKLKQHDDYFTTNSSLFQEWILDNFHQQYQRICKDSKEIAKIITSRTKLKATPFEKISRIAFHKGKNKLAINVGNDRLVYISKDEVSFSENKALSFQYEHSSNHIPYDYCEESATLIFRNFNNLVMSYW